MLSALVGMVRGVRAPGSDDRFVIFLPGYVMLFLTLFASLFKSSRRVPHQQAGHVTAPDQCCIPTVAEFVPGYEASGWYGIGAPKGTPAEIIRKLNNEINAVLADPKLKARLADLGGTVLTGSPMDFGKLIVDETEKWGKVVKFVGIKAD